MDPRIGAGWLNLAVAVEAVVAMMRIGVEVAVQHQGPEHERPDGDPGSVPLLLRGLLAKRLVGLAADELSREDATGGERVMNLRNDHPLHPLLAPHRHAGGFPCHYGLSWAVSSVRESSG